MNDFKEFVLINLFFDLMLIATVGYLLKKHLPRLFAFLLVCNFLPYLFALPLADIPGIKNRGHGEPGYFDLLDVARRPENIIGKNNIPAPRVQISQIVGLFQPLASGFKKDPANPNDSFLAHWQKSLRVDPYALWLCLRIFWTLGALVMICQRRILGAGMAGLQLLPLPYLAYAVPYGALYLISKPAFAVMDESAPNASEIQDLLTPRFYALAAGAGGVFLVFVSVLLMLAFSRQLAPKRLLAKTYLDPKKYWVKLNGGVHPFEVEGTRLLIGEVAFECKNIEAVDPRRPHVWRLDTNTLLEFMKRPES